MTRSIVIGETDFDQLSRHLWDREGEERAAILAVGTSRTPTQCRLLVRRVIPVPDEHFTRCAGRYHLSSRIVADACLRLAKERLGYVSVHNHPMSTNVVQLSAVDRRSNRMSYPTILDLVHGQPVASLVFGEHSAAGEVWEPGQRPRPLDFVRIVGRHVVDLRPQPEFPPAGDERHARQVLLFGSAGQRRLAGLTVGIVGLGGGGSVLVQQLAHLGVGAIVGVDPDIVMRHNLSRIVGATQADAEHAAKKVAVMRRLVQSIDRRVRFEGIDGDVTDLAVAQQLTACDFLFCATDNLRSRNVVNQLSYQFLIPAIQSGVKIETDRATGAVIQIHGMVRPMLPDLGCLHCHGAISPTALARELLTPEDRKAQDYTNEPDLKDPSVIALNSCVASTAVTDFLHLVTGLFPDLPDVLNLQHRAWLPLTREWKEVEHRRDSRCRTCGRGERSAYARGDRWDLLPCRAQE